MTSSPSIVRTLCSDTMSFNAQGYHLDEDRPARVFTPRPLTPAHLIIFEEQAAAPLDPTLANWMETLFQESFAAASSDAAQLNALIISHAAPYKLPKSLSSVSDVLKAWNEGVKGLPPMRLFVGNKHSTLRTDRSERKRLSDHKRVVMAVELLGRKHELDSNGEPRPLRVIRAMLEEEAQKK
ncbi:hypothetical protein I4F81_011937 [Pyropia yezoensis]|uniref:Uncharacterized protein n=1 Tax=Pyropia yezoensis TaxID=2788 RepID=A0ACC3CGR7_PYRYE|nr:hypothetical protein I4F81_011937 [Neopyropia yezoensis]